MTTQTAAAPVIASTCTPNERVTKSLLGYGPLAGAVFLGSIFIQGLTRHGFRIAHHDASLLANGPLGWIQITTFLVAGAMTIAAAVGAHRAMASRWGPRLLGIYGAGLMAAGLLRADPAEGFGPGAPAGRAAQISWHGAGHLISASVGFIAFIAACFVLARYFHRAGHRGLAISTPGSPAPRSWPHSLASAAAPVLPQSCCRSTPPCWPPSPGWRSSASTCTATSPTPAPPDISPAETRQNKTGELRCVT